MATYLVKTDGLIGPILDKHIAETLKVAAQGGLIPKDRATDKGLVAWVQDVAVGSVMQHALAYQEDIQHAADACQKGCMDEFSVFSCYAYLIELVKLSPLDWDQLKQRFKQDFLGVTTAPVRQIDIAIKVLERAIVEDLGNPPRVAANWNEYDNALNAALIGVLRDCMRKSEAELAACFASHPVAFDPTRLLHEQNEGLKRILSNLEREACYFDVLVQRLKEQTGKSQAELQQKYPDVFQTAMTFEGQNKTLERILGLPEVATRVDRMKAELAILQMDALIYESGQLPTDLRQRYHISFAPTVCSETTTCRQAILTLQEHLAGAGIKYPTYDEWRLEQSKRFYPENAYSHEFKIPLIQGDRQLLRQHLEQARKILDSVLVATGQTDPKEDNLLNSFSNRTFYNNFRIGLDLIQECWEVDDLMVKGHEAFFQEEFQLARTYYLAAAEKIRQTSGMLSPGMGNVLLSSLWVPEGDCFFRRPPNETTQKALDFWRATLSSFEPSNKPDVQLIREDRLSLNGVDEDGTFKPLSNQGKEIASSDWIEISGQWEALREGHIQQPDPIKLMGVLVYQPRTDLTDLRVEIDTYTADDMFCGILFRVPVSVPLKGSSPFAGLYQPYKDDKKQWMSKLLDDSWQISGSSMYPLLTLVPEGYLMSETGTRRFDRIMPTANRIRATLKESRLEVEYRKVRADDDNKHPRGKLDSADLDGTILTTDFVNIQDRGSFGLFAYCFEKIKHFPGHNKWNRFTSIKVWELNKATGPVSDAAFALSPGVSVEAAGLLWGYLARTASYNDPAAASSAFKKLPIMISLSYGEGGYIVRRHKDSQPLIDPFYNGAESKRLWYVSGDDCLNRENLRKWLDSLPVFFCHQYFFLLPVCLGDVANALGQFEEALQWYRMVYDERRPTKEQGVYAFLNDTVEGEMLRLRIAQNYVEWADFLFNQNTEESINEARIRYALALRTLETEKCCEESRHRIFYLHDLGKRLSALANVDATVLSRIHQTVAVAAGKAGDFSNWRRLGDEIQPILEAPDIDKVKIARINDLLTRMATTLAPQPRLSEIAQKAHDLPRRLVTIEQQHPEILDQVENSIRVSTAIAADSDRTQTISLPSQQTATGPMQGSPRDASPITVGSLPPVHPPLGHLSVPLKVYNDPALRRTLEKLPRGIVPSLPVPRLPNPLPLRPADVSGSSGLPYVYFVLPPWLLFDLCIPQNPVVEALTSRACLGIYLIDYCFNALGFPQNDLSIYRFEYLLSMAKNFSQMALAAEKDFIQFKDQFEKDAYELMNASQAVAIAQAGVNLAQLKVQEANNQIDVAYQGIQRVNDQIALVQQRINELGSPWAVFGIVFGAIAAFAAAYFTAGASLTILAKLGIGATAGALTGAAGGGSYMAGIEDNKEALEMQLQILKTDEYNAARQNLRNSIDARFSAQQQARIAELDARYTAEKTAFLSAEFFNPQLWSFLAREVKKNYHTYLTYGTIAAWLAQRALEFERGVEPRRRFAATGPGDTGSGLNIVRFDYFQPSLQGLLGADSLHRDIATLENEKFLQEQRKKQITKVISLAATRPYVFAQFLQTGMLPFATTLEEFDWDYPGHYQRRIRNVRINLFGLVGQEGIKATLTCLGASQVVVKKIVVENGQPKSNFVEKTLRHPSESVALTGPLGGGIGQIPLVPKEEMLNPFEGLGVAAQWVFEMPKYANQIDYSTITDIQILIDYSALDDAVYRDEALGRLPRRRHALRTFSFRLAFPDALFRLKDSPLPLGMIQTGDNTTGLYTLVLDTQPEDFAPNQADRKLTDVVLYIRSKGQDLRPLRIKLAARSALLAQNPNWREADLTPNSFTYVETPPITSKESTDIAPHYLGRQPIGKPGITESVVDRWYFYFSPTDNDAFVKKEGGNPVLVNGHKVLDFSEIEDVIFGLNYGYDALLPDPWSKKT